MTSPNVIPLHPRNHRRSRVLDMHGATVTRLSEHRSLGSRYQDSCRQADVLNASIGELWLRAYLTSITAALVIAGVSHATEENTMAKGEISGEVDSKT